MEIHQMGYNITEKIIRQHLVEGSMVPGEDVSLKVDQTLNPDSSGTMVFLQFEAMGIQRIQTELSVSYADHQTLYAGYENADDHRYLQDVAAKYGVRFSRAGNGICHQVHLERFGIPGKFLLGADSHTPTAGALGMLAIAAGGLDVALALAGRPYSFPMPRIIRLELKGKLGPWVSAKDVILDVLHRLSCKGGTGRVIEYGGPGVSTLSVPERGTIANMGAELGATTSIFPSDEQTRVFMEAQGRGNDFRMLEADPDAIYEQTIEMDLSILEPMVALPHLPDNVLPVRKVAGLPLDQVFIGSCTNSSFVDLSKAAAIVKGKIVAPNTSFVVAPGSRQVFNMIAKSGALSNFIQAGARILESSCGPCIGIGQAPCSAGTSLRTSNRNFEGRSGTKDAKLYLGSVETAAASAIAGVLTDPRTLGEPITIKLPVKFEIDDRMIVMPPIDGSSVKIRRGPNIVPLPQFPRLADETAGEVLLKVGDNITTDHILPGGSKVMPYRSNIPAISKFCFAAIDETFHDRAKASGGGFVVGGSNYGQGSSREHAAMVPRYLGVKAVLAKSYARIHRQNLINMGILPIIFAEDKDYERIAQGDRIEIKNLHTGVDDGKLGIQVISKSGKREIIGVLLPLLAKEKEILKSGGALNYAVDPKLK
jgi:aconitate hydratase